MNIDQEALKLAVHSRDSWRMLAKMLLTLMEEGGPKGRPMDLVTLRDWKCVRNALAAAESTDN